MKIGRAYAQRDEWGYPHLYVEIDGEWANLGCEQKHWREGLIYLGPEWEDKVSTVVPANPADGRPYPEEYAGMVRNAELAQIYKEYYEKVLNAGRLAPLPMVLKEE